MPLSFLQISKLSSCRKSRGEKSADFCNAPLPLKGTPYSPSPSPHQGEGIWL